MTTPAAPGGLAPAGPSMDYYIPQWEERTSYGVRRVDPYTKLFEDRIIFLGVQVDDASADDVMALVRNHLRNVPAVMMSSGRSFPAPAPCNPCQFFLDPPGAALP